MKTYYALGDKRLNTIVIHGKRSGIGKEGMHCTFMNLLFKHCPPVHPATITDKNLIQNFNACHQFKLFDTKEQAESYKEKNLKWNETTAFNQLSYMPGHTDLPIFKIEVTNEAKIEHHDGVKVIKKDAGINYLQGIYQAAPLTNITPDFLKPR